MTEHDPLCKQRFDPYQPPCPECEIIATARADQDNRECDHCTDLARLKIANLRAKAGKLPRRYRKEHGKWLITVDVADLTALFDGEQR